MSTQTNEKVAKPKNARKDGSKRPTPAQRKYLMRGLAEPGGKLPLFDLDGQRINRQTIQSCMDNGWCEPWTKNPILPSWLVCRLTARGKMVVAK